MERRTFCTLIGLSFLASIATRIIEQSKHNLIAVEKPIPSTNTITYYVSPSGDDRCSGLSPQASNSCRTEGPFKTIEKARDTVRRLKQQQGGILQQPIKILISGGTYFLERPIELTFQDSGAAKTPIYYLGDPQNKPVISGGKIIKGWQQETVNGKTAWTVTIPEVKNGQWYFQQLWVNGTRRYRSRYPKRGYLKIKSVEETGDWQDGHKSFQFDSNRLPQGINWSQAEAVVLNRWIESRLPVSKIDERQGKIFSTKKTVFSLDPNDLFYLENALAILEHPGEWFLDRDRGKLYYLPLPGERIETIEAIAPYLENTLVFRGEATKNRYIQYLKFQNLVFSHTNWLLPPELAGFVQNAYGVSATIAANGIKYCNWESCTVTKIGNYAFELMRGCQHNQITNCKLHDLGAGGIKVGERKTDMPNISTSEVSHHNRIISNEVFNGGRFFPSAVGIRTVHSHNNLIANNHVHDLYYTAISVRGTWGFGKTNAYQNIVEHNNIHHIGKLANGEGPILSDMGGVYTLGRQDGTVIRGNLIRDVSGIYYGGWGVYLDEGSTNIVVENNLVYRCRHGCFSLHFGKENIIRNNIFAFGEEYQIYRGQRDYATAQQEQYVSLRFERNIFCWNSGIFIGKAVEDPSVNIAFDYNLYWSADEVEIKFGDLSWNQWRKSGQDFNSQIANPLFVSLEEDDFRLAPNSPAIELGFNPNVIPTCHQLNV